jgi:hypothetical protein
MDNFKIVSLLSTIHFFALSTFLIDVQREQGKFHRRSFININILWQEINYFSFSILFEKNVSTSVFGMLQLNAQMSYEFSILSSLR